MENELLDDNLIHQGKQKVQSKILKWVPIIILWVGIGISISFGIISKLNILGGLLLLSISTVISYYNFKIGAWVTLGSIILGVFNFIEFFPMTFEIRFGPRGTNIGIEIELILAGICLLHFIINGGLLAPGIQKALYSEGDGDSSTKLNESSLGGFKRRFSNKSIPELKEIVNNKKLVEEARHAAMTLLKEKEEIK